MPRRALDSAHIYAIVLIALPWACVAINNNWLSSPPGFVDPWLYHGYFHRFPEFVSTLFQERYYGTRLAWIVPGYVAYALLPPNAANLALHIGVYYLAVAFFYRAIRVLADRDRAFVSAVVFGTSWPALVALGWDYVDGAVIAYSTVAFASAFNVARRVNPSWNAALTGVAAAAMVHSNLGAILLLPAVLASYVALRGRTPLRQEIPYASAFVSGALGITAVLGAVNAWAGGPWLFFMPSVHWLKDTIGVQKFTPIPLTSWLHSWPLVWPVTGSIIAVALLAKRRTPSTVAAVVPILLLLTTFALYDWAVDGGMLRTFYYVSWLFVPTLFALAAAMPALGQSSAVLAAAVVMTVNGLALMNARDPLFDGVLTLPGVGLGAVAIASALFLARRTLTALVALVCLLNVFTPASFRADPQARVQFDLVQRTLTFVANAVPAHRRPIFWLQQGPSNSFFASIASTYLYLYSLLGSEYPHLPDDATKQFRFGATLGTDATIIVVSYQPPDAAKVQREFDRFHLVARMRATQPVEHGSIRFVLTTFDISPK